MLLSELAVGGRVFHESSPMPPAERHGNLHLDAGGGPPSNVETVPGRSDPCIGLPLKRFFHLEYEH